MPVVDAEVVDAAVAAGVGATIRAPLGGKLDPALARSVTSNARVAGIGDGRFDVKILGFESFDTGGAVLMEIGATRVVVSEERGIGGNHSAVYEQFGLAVGEAQMVVVKTASNRSSAPIRPSDARGGPREGRCRTGGRPPHAPSSS